MKRIKPNAQQWPRHAVETVDCRKRDLVVRIGDWTRTRDTPTYDVEVYIGGVYDWNESKCCKTKADAIAFASAQIEKLL